MHLTTIKPMILNFDIENPNLLLKDELIEHRGYTVTEVAKMLNITRSNVSKILNGRALLSPNMALRITTVFGGSAKLLLDMQNDYLLQKERAVFNSSGLTKATDKNK